MNIPVIIIDGVKLIIFTITDDTTFELFILMVHVLYQIYINENNPPILPNRIIIFINTYFSLSNE